MTLEIQFLPARQGDSIWIRWPGEDRTRQILIDLGTEEIGRAWHERLALLPVEERAFDLLVVSHVDRDHIGGVLTALAEADEPLEGFTFGDVWFNGWEHLAGGTVPEPTVRRLEGMGPAQGERLAKWLRQQPWNEEFGRGPVVLEAPEPRRVEFEGGLSLTVLGPTPERLAKFQPLWKEEVEAAIESGGLDAGEVSPGLESYGPKVPPILETREDLEELADTRTRKDPSKANGSSIVLLLEWHGRRVLLSGDAFADDLVKALELLPEDAPTKLDAFKLPHHGSAKNIDDDLVRAVDCPTFVFSTDGTQFRHPDPIAIARILRSCVRERPKLSFNVPSKYNGWWNEAAWLEAFDYEVEYGDAANGCTLTFDPS